MEFIIDGTIWERVEKIKKIDVDNCGMTKEESKCHKKFMEAFQLWIKLERQHPNEAQDMTNAIHLIQGLLCMRAARRKFKGWATYRIKKKKQ